MPADGIAAHSYLVGQPGNAHQAVPAFLLARLTSPRSLDRPLEVRDSCSAEVVYGNPHSLRRTHDLHHEEATLGA
ncbi:MAG TPA: hypothetical protein VFV66_11075 [Nonomuraea sp.]|nr:hypothetical protein [Nonomuraea sp.]